MTMKNDLLLFARKKRVWTQAQLAENLEIAVRTVRSWESGDRILSLQQRLRLCDLLGMTATQLGLEQNGTERPIGGFQ